MTKKSKIRFADIIIVICVALMSFLIFATVYEYHRLTEPMPASVLAILMGGPTGELLTIACRQVFGSDVVIKRTAQIPRNQEENGSI